MLKRIPFEHGLSAFWIERREDFYVAYRSFRAAMLDIASPSLMFSLGQSGLQALYSREV